VEARSEAGIESNRQRSRRSRLADLVTTIVGA
jgi:hypothetical protein